MGERRIYVVGENVPEKSGERIMERIVLQMGRGEYM